MICKLPHEREWPTDNHRTPPFKHPMSFFTPRENHYWELCISNVGLWANKIKRAVGRLFAGGKMGAACSSQAREVESGNSFNCTLD